MRLEQLVKELQQNIKNLEKKDELSKLNAVSPRQLATDDSDDQ